MIPLHERCLEETAPEPCILFPENDEDIQAAAAAINDRLKPATEVSVTRAKPNNKQGNPPVPPKSPLTRLATDQKEQSTPSETSPSSWFDTTENIDRASTALGIFPPAAEPQPQRSENACGHSPSSPRRKPGHEKQPSIINRGRPKKRHNRDLGTPLKQLTAVEEASFQPFPSGFGLVAAKKQLSPSEVDRLQRQARNQAQQFEVFKHDDARLLSLVHLLATILNLKKSLHIRNSACLTNDTNTSATHTKPSG